MAEVNLEVKFFIFASLQFSNTMFKVASFRLIQLNLLFSDHKSLDILAKSVRQNHKSFFMTVRKEL